jgi:hypothetical protein
MLARLIPAALLALLLASCGALPKAGGTIAKGVASAALGADSGLSVETDVQAGGTQNRTLGKTENKSQKLEKVEAEKIVQSADETAVKADTVQNLTIHEAPESNLPQALIALLVGFATGLLAAPLWRFLKSNRKRERGTYA